MWICINSRDICWEDLHKSNNNNTWFNHESNLWKNIIYLLVYCMCTVDPWLSGSNSRFTKPLIIMIFLPNHLCTLCMKLYMFIHRRFSWETLRHFVSSNNKNCTISKKWCRHAFVVFDFKDKFDGWLIKIIYVNKTYKVDMQKFLFFVVYGFSFEFHEKD